MEEVNKIIVPYIRSQPKNLVIANFIAKYLQLFRFIFVILKTLRIIDLETLLKHRIKLLVTVLTGTLLYSASYAQEAYFAEHEDDIPDKKEAHSQSYYSDVQGYQIEPPVDGGGSYPEDTEETDTDHEQAVPTPPPTPKSSKNPTPEEKITPTTDAQPTEPVLSFNFLYYIIQKFKFSDIIE